MRNTNTAARRYGHRQPLMMGMATGLPRPHVEPDLLDLAEVALRLNVSRTTIWRLAKRGDIRVVRIGSRTLIPRSELHRIIGDEPWRSQ